MIKPKDEAVASRDREMSDKDRLNEAFHELLREAAEQRDARECVHALQDAEAAARESAALLSLARRTGSGS